MKPTGIKYHFSLSRRQRLINLPWAAYSFVLGLLPLLWGAFFVFWQNESAGWAGIGAGLFILYWSREDIYFIYRFFSVAEESVCFSVNEHHIGFGRNTADGVIPLERVKRFSRAAGLWRIRYYRNEAPHFPNNIYIPVSMLPQEDVSFLQSITAKKTGWRRKKA